MATELETKIAQFETDLGVAHEIVHGDDETTVETEGGPVKSFAKAIADGVAGIAAALAAALDDALDAATGAIGAVLTAAEGARDDAVAARDVAVAAAGEAVVAVAGSEIDLAQGGWFTKTFSAGAISPTVTGWPAAGTVASFTFEMRKAGLATITWPASWKWAGGIEPAWSEDATDIIVAVSRDGGATVYAGLVFYGLDPEE